jgi:hypothetical protein
MKPLLTSSIIIIFFVVVLVLWTSREAAIKWPAPVTVKTRVMNADIAGWTRVALQDDGSSIPYTISICGEHAELWQGEHVLITLQGPPDYDGWDKYPRCYTIKHLERLD